MGHIPVRTKVESDLYLIDSDPDLKMSDLMWLVLFTLPLNNQVWVSYVREGGQPDSGHWARCVNIVFDFAF